MKSLLLALALISPAAHASIRAGTHEMECESTNHALGVGYSLKVTTESGENVTGITLMTQVVYPGAKIKHYDLEEENQTAKLAVFSDKDSKVVLDKDSFRAKIYLDSKHAYDCYQQ